MKTSPGESTRTIRPEYFGATSKNCFQVLISSLTTLVRTPMPVVPQSLGTCHSSFGSHQMPLNSLSTFLAFGTAREVDLLDEPLLSHRRDELGGRSAHVPLADRAALELGHQLVVGRERVVRELVDAMGFDLNRAMLLGSMYSPQLYMNSSFSMSAGTAKDGTGVDAAPWDDAADGAAELLEPAQAARKAADADIVLA